MKERPIIFNAEMVRAILEGRKTMTRRPIKFQFINWNPLFCHDHPKGGYQFSDVPEYTECGSNGKFSPFGQIGEQLWVRETFRISTPDDCSCYDECNCKSGYPIYKASFNQGENEKWIPSIHMPRCASRITLEITSVRVERVQEITEEDAKNEGIDNHESDYHFRNIQEFKKLWDSIYSEKYPWNSNPWVWVIEFKRVEVSS